MDATTLFGIANNIALIGWILLITAYSWSPVNKIIKLGVIPLLLSVFYAYAIFSSWGGFTFSDFGSLSGVMSLFQNETAVLAGWVHYLAFDLWVGCWIMQDAVQRGIRWYAVPSLLLTFMMGPVGLLSYVLVRWILTKKLLHDNF